MKTIIKYKKNLVIFHDCNNKYTDEKTQSLIQSLKVRETNRIYKKYNKIYMQFLQLIQKINK